MSREQLLRTYLRQTLLREGETLESLSPDMLENLGPIDLPGFLQDGRLTEPELDMLEAIIVPGQRPVFLLRGNTLPEADARLWPAWAHPWLDVKSKIEAAAQATLRIESVNRLFPYHGTGFLVGEGLLLTNRHVASAFVSERGLGKPRFEALYRTWASPHREKAFEGTPSEMAILGALWVHPYWDAALLEVELSGDLQNVAPLELLAAAPEQLADRPVAIVGHPYKGSYASRSDGPTQERDIFGGEDDRSFKRAQPGMLRGIASLRGVRVLEHDASTLQGNSGSAVLDLESGAVIGLHYSGTYLQGNYAVPSWELARDTRIGARLRVRGTPLADEDPAVRGAWEGRVQTPPAPLVASAPAARFRRSGLDRFTHTDEATRWNLALSEPATLRQDAIEALGDKHGDFVAGAIGQLAEEAERPTEASKLPVDAPEIIYLHGILGGHLSWKGTRQKHLWLAPWSMATLDLGEALLLQDDGLTDASTPPGTRLMPTGHLGIFYDFAAYTWRLRGFVVHSFSYDWRKSIAHAADRLHAFIEELHANSPGTRYAIVAHSMGGLVALQYAHAHAVALQRIQRAVLLGSPIQGSFEPLAFLSGRSRLANKLAMITPSSRDGLSRFARACPGLLDMLPSPTAFPEAEAVYHRSSWPAGQAPLQRWLDQSRALKAVLRQSPLLERTTALVSVDHRTIGSLGEGDTLSLGPSEWAGDGIVPASSAVPPGLDAYVVDFLHSQIPTDPRAIQAVTDILLDGRPSQLRRVRDSELSRRIGTTPETISLPAGEESFRPLGPADLLWLFSEADAAPRSEVDAWVRRLEAEESLESPGDLERELDRADPDVVYAALRQYANNNAVVNMTGEESLEVNVPESPSPISTFGDPLERLWEDWLGEHSVRTDGAVKVRSPEALQQLLRMAHTEGWKVKVTGDRHSDNDLAQPEQFRVDLSSLSGMIPLQPTRPGIDRAFLRRFWAGTTIAQVNALLDQEQLALPNMGSYDGQHLVGALCTGSHGSGRLLGPMADFIASMEVVTETGELLVVEPEGAFGISREDLPNLVPNTRYFQALQVGIGTLGIVVAVTLRVRGRFDLCEIRQSSTWALTRQRWAQRLQNFDHYEILINPYPTRPDGSWRGGANELGHTTIETQRWEPREGESGLPVPTEPDDPEDQMVPGSRNPNLRLARDWSRPLVVGLMNRLPQTQGWFLDQALKALRVPWKDNGEFYRDRSFRVLKLGLGVKAHGFEMAVPLDKLDQAVEVILEIAAFYKSHPHPPSRALLTSPFSVRFVKASEALIAPQHRQRVQEPPAEIWAMIEVPRLFGTRRPHLVVSEIERRLKALGARPHWGQRNELRAGEPERLYPRWNDFVAEFRARNRTAVFSNALTRRLQLDPAPVTADEGPGGVPAWVANRHVVNLEGEGWFSTTEAMESSLTQVKRIFEQALPASGRSSLLLYAHGGLVNEANGLQSAQDKGQALLGLSQSYPLFVIWHTGLLEILPQVILDLFRDEQLARKLLWWVVRTVGRSLLPDWDALWSAVTDGAESPRRPPEQGLVSLQQGRLEEIEAELHGEMQLDGELRAELHRLDAPAEPGNEAPSAGSTLDPTFLSALRSNEEITVASSLLTFARFAAQIAWRAWRRNRSELSWNGMKDTILEEILREVGGHKVGRVGWSRMKANTEAAYRPDHGGEVLLDCVAEWLRGDPQRQLQLVAHSAGSFHVGWWLTGLAQRLPQRPMLANNVILLAPACDDAFFVRHIAAQRARIERFRIFSLSEAQERRSQMIPHVYDGSLLCLVSGLLEETWGWPVTGLMRTRRLSEGEAADAVRAFLLGWPGAQVQSPTEAGATLGARSHALTHDTVDDADGVLESIAALLDGRIEQPQGVANAPDTVVGVR